MKTLALEHISVRYGTVHALSDVSVALDAGDVLMLIGPNGAGKSTLNKVLLGLVRPNAGTLRLDDKPIRVDSSLKAHLGYLPEAVAFSENLTGQQVLRFFARARNIPKRRIDEVLERVNLKHAAKRAVRGYSRGMRQRLGLAVAILSDPPLLVLDEPTGGLDQEGLSVLWSILAEWREKERMVLLSTHDMALLERHSTRVCVLRSGVLIANGAPDALRRSTELPQRITLSLANNTAAHALTQTLQGWERCTVTASPSHLCATLADRDLLEFLALQSLHPGALRHIRIEEPTLDQVYEKLLEDR